MAAVANGLASASVLTMGEGSEQTPIAIISEVPFVKFQDRNPTKEELELFYLKDKDEDLFAPFLNAVKWLPGKRKKV
jgi:F420-0:gamma-glutamyl ligase